MPAAQALSGRLWLAETADTIIRAEARTRRLVETGGPLFGYTDPDSGDSVVSVAYGPGPDARHRPRSLRPDRHHTQQAIGEMYERSKGTLSYVGDWHTHPGGNARPSGYDLRSLAAIATESDVELPDPIALIFPTVILRRRVRVRDPAAYRWIPGTFLAEQLPVIIRAAAAPRLGKP